MFGIVVVVVYFFHWILIGLRTIFSNIYSALTSELNSHSEMEAFILMIYNIYIEAIDQTSKTLQTLNFYTCWYRKRTHHLWKQKIFKYFLFWTYQQRFQYFLNKLKYQIAGLNWNLFYNFLEAAPFLIF